MSVYSAEYHQKMQSTRKGRTTILLNRVRNRSRRFGTECDLDIEWLRRKIEEQDDRCARTGIPFSYEAGPPTPWQPSLDRKDSTKGYTKDNVQVVCLMYNLAKNAADDDDVRSFAIALLEHTS